MGIFRHIPVLIIFFLSCQNRESDPPSYTAFTGATIIDESGAKPTINGILLLKQGRVVAVRTAEEVDIPEGAIIQPKT